MSAAKKRLLILLGSLSLIGSMVIVWIAVHSDEQGPSSDWVWLPLPDDPRRALAYPHDSYEHLSNREAAEQLFEKITRNIVEDTFGKTTLIITYVGADFFQVTSLWTSITANEQVEVTTTGVIRRKGIDDIFTVSFIIEGLDEQRCVYVITKLGM